jgi:hypothetical protein
VPPGLTIGGFAYPLWIASAIPLATFGLGALSCKILGKWTWLFIILGIAGVFLLKIEGG